MNICDNNNIFTIFHMAPAIIPMVIYKLKYNRRNGAKIIATIVDTLRDLLIKSLSIFIVIFACPVYYLYSLPGACNKA